MEQLTIFYQAEGLASVEVIEVERETTVVALRELLGKKHGWPSEVVLFAEDIDDELDTTVLVREFEIAAGTKLHAHRCRKIDVSVSFNGVAFPHVYAPSATIVRIKRHAAIDGSTSPKRLPPSTCFRSRGVRRSRHPVRTSVRLSVTQNAASPSTLFRSTVCKVR